MRKDTALAGRSSLWTAHEGYEAHQHGLTSPPVHTEKDLSQLVEEPNKQRNKKGGAVQLALVMLMGRTQKQGPAHDRLG